MDKDKLLELLEDYLADADKIVIEKTSKTPPKAPKAKAEKEPAEGTEEEDEEYKAALNDILGEQHDKADDKDED